MIFNNKIIKTFNYFHNFKKYRQRVIVADVKCADLALFRTLIRYI